MRLNMSVEQQNRTSAASERLISTTDLTIHITYCNDAFFASVAAQFGRAL